ncbi:zinc ABC transporter substrate-binding protein [Deinococcus deserti]|nr:zinc ABC transporter substrate-binding protein [Deinococcus deserti]
MTTTVNMVGDLARVVGGQRVTVTALMGTVGNPHLYEATARNVRKLVSSDLVLCSGLHLKGKVTELLEKYRLAGGFGSVQGLYDPHVWFDASLWKMAATTRKPLSAVGSVDRAISHRNTAAHLRHINSLDKEVMALVQAVPRQQRVVVTAHDALNYFGQRYGPEVRGVQGMSTAPEAGTRDIPEVARLVVQRRIPALFVKSSVPQRTIKAVVAAVRDQGHRVRVGGQLFSDALGSRGTPQGFSLGRVSHNSRAISSALRGK